MRLHDLSLATRITIGVLSIVVAGTATLTFAENVHHRDVYLSELCAHLENDLETEKVGLNQAVDTPCQDALFLANIPPVSGIARAALNQRLWGGGRRTARHLGLSPARLLGFARHCQCNKRTRS